MLILKSKKTRFQRQAPHVACGTGSSSNKWHWNGETACVATTRSCPVTVPRHRSVGRRVEQPAAVACSPRHWPHESCYHDELHRSC